MKGKLIGVMQKSGTFKPKDGGDPIKYDNVVLYALERLAESSDPDNKAVGEGYYLHTLKIKSSNVNQVIDYPVSTLSDFEQFKGCQIEWFYNQFGNIDSVKLTEEG